MIKLKNNRAHERASLSLSNTRAIRASVAKRKRESDAVYAAQCLLGRDYHVLRREDLDTGAISSILTDWYYPEVRALADSVIRDVRLARGLDAPRSREYVTDEITRESTEDEVREWVQVRVDSDTDSHRFVVCTYQAKLVCVASDNENAYADEIGEAPPTVETQACMAMRADVWGQLAAREDEWLHAAPYVAREDEWLHAASYVALGAVLDHPDYESERAAGHVLHYLPLAKLWAWHPESYDPAQLTESDVAHDSQIRTVPAALAADLDPGCA